MVWDDILRRFADSARPTCIYWLGGSLAIGPFVHADVGLMGISSAAFLALIGARSFENATQIKATASTTSATVTTPTATATQTQGVQNPAPVTDSTPPIPQKPHMG